MGGEEGGCGTLVEAQGTARVDVPTASNPLRLHDERIHWSFDPSMLVLPRTVVRQVLCASDATQFSRLKNVTVWSPGPGPPRYVSRVFAVFSKSRFFNLPAL